MAFRAALSKSLTDWALLGAIGICLVATALRIAPLGESLWLDELHTAWCAVGPFDEVARRAAIGNQAPLFFWLEWTLLNVLGPSELSLRLISVIGGSLLPLAIFLFARHWKLDTAGLVAAGLVAVDPLSIFYATEARPYAALQLLAVIHVALTAQITKQPTVRLRLAWIAVAAALFYFHYTAALVIFASGVFLLLARLVRPLETRNGFYDVLLDVAVVGLLCLPQLPGVQAVFAHRANWATFVKREPIWEAIDWFPLPAWWWVVLVVMGFVGIGQEAKTGISLRRLECEHIYFLVTWWLAIPLSLVWLATWTDTARLFFPRYLVCVLPGAALFAGLCVYTIEWRWPRRVIGILTIVCAAWTSGIIGQIVHDGRVIADRNEDWRACVAWLNEQVPQTQFPVLVFSGLIEADELRQPHDELLEDYCLAPVNSLYPLDVDRGDMLPLPLHEPGKLEQVVEMLVVHRGGAWLIVRGENNRGRHVADEITAHLQRAVAPGAATNWHIDQSKSFNKVQILLLTTQASDQHSNKDPSIAGP